MVEQHHQLNRYESRQVVKDTEAWGAAVHVVTESRTWLSDWTTGFILVSCNLKKIASFIWRLDRLDFFYLYDYWYYWVMSNFVSVILAIIYDYPMDSFFFIHLKIPIFYNSIKLEKHLERNSFDYYLVKNVAFRKEKARKFLNIFFFLTNIQQKWIP